MQSSQPRRAVVAEEQEKSEKQEEEDEAQGRVRDATEEGAELAVFEEEEGPTNAGLFRNSLRY